MSLQVWSGGPFTHVTEREDKAQIIDSFSRLFAEDGEDVCLVFNFCCDGADIDLAIFKNDGIAVVDLKRAGSPFQAAENGPWKFEDGTALKGGSHRNPFMQVKSYRHRMIEFLTSSGNRFLGVQKASQTNFRNSVRAIVAVFPTIPIGTQLDFSPRVSPWFCVVGGSQLGEAAQNLTHPSLSLRTSEIEVLLSGVLRCEREQLKGLGSDATHDKLSQDQKPASRPTGSPKEVPSKTSSAGFPVGRDGVRKAFEERKTILCKVARDVAGGYEVDIGIVGLSGFLPRSRSGARTSEEMIGIIGQTIECQILKIGEPDGRPVVDRRGVLAD